MAGSSAAEQRSHGERGGGCLTVGCGRERRLVGAGKEEAGGSGREDGARGGRRDGPGRLLLLAAQSLEQRGAVSGGEGGVELVLLEVSVEVGLLAEAALAEMAAEGLLLVVDVAHVALEVGADAEAALAVGALVRLLAGVRPQMPREVGRSREDLAAELAGVAVLGLAGGGGGGGGSGSVCALERGGEGGVVEERGGDGSLLLSTRGCGRSASVGGEAGEEGGGETGGRRGAEGEETGGAGRDAAGGSEEGIGSGLVIEG